MEFLGKYKNQLIWIILLAAILTFFKSPVNQVLVFFIVKPLFSNFSIGIAGQLFFIVLVSGYSYWAFLKFNKVVLINIALLTFTFYIFQRFLDNWSFYPFSDLGTHSRILRDIGYLDFLTIGMILPGIIALFIGEEAAPDFVEDPRGFVQDNPIIDLADDTFARNSIAKQIAEMIGFTNNQRSFAIGILGEYGSGKTSFLNLINNALPDDGYMKLEFNPWDSENASSIQKDFFDQFVAVIAGIDPKVSSLLYSYCRKISRIDETTKSWVNRINLIGESGHTVRENEKSKINDALQRANKKIIITIDDLDRLHSDEVIEVLRIIRNTANFSNVFYLVAYEKAYVQNAIKKLNDEGDHNYLDKIFQIEIPLPKRDDNALINFLKIKIENVLTAEHLQVLEDKIIPNDFKNKYGESFDSIFRHSRDVIKFVNGFKMIYILIGEEVDFTDLFTLELLKFRFQLVYDLLYEQRNNFIHLNPSIASHQEFYVATGSTIDKDSVTNFRKFTIASSLVKNEEIELLNALFNKLFKGEMWYRPETKNGISYPLYFEIYFRQRLSSYDLSDRDFKAAMSSTNIYRYIDDCVSKNLHHAIMIRLFQEELTKVSRNHYEKVIRALFYLGPQYILKTSTTSFPYQQLIELLANYSGETVKKIYNNDGLVFQTFVKSLFDTASVPYLFQHEFIFYLRDQRKNFIIPDNDLIDYQISYFNRYVDSGHGLNMDVVWILWGIREYYKATGADGTSGQWHWRFDSKVLPRLKRALMETDPKYFLKETIKRNLGEEEVVWISKHILDIFETPEEFRNIISANPQLEVDIKQEYLNLFDRLAEVSFNHAVPMIFTTMLNKG